jgi:hypothetical protein
MIEQKGSDVGKILLIGGLVIGGGYLLWKGLSSFFGSNPQALINQKVAQLQEVNGVIEQAFVDGTIDNPEIQAYLNEKEKLDKTMELQIETAGTGWIDKLRSTIYATMGFVAVAVAGWIGVSWLSWKLKQNPRPPGTPPGQPITYTCPVEGQQFETQTQIYNHISQFHTATSNPVLLGQAQQIFRQQYEYIQGTIAVESELHGRITVSNWESLTPGEILILGGAVVVVSVFVAPALAPSLVPLLLAP